jgi:hypothetical protein
LLLPVLSEALLMTFLGPSLGSPVLTLTLLEVLSRMSWLAFLLGGSCLGGDFNVTRFLAKRSREVRLNAAIMEFSNLFFRVGPYGSPSCRRDFYLVQ